MTLKYLAVGTGRDGTVSLAHLLNEVFKLNGISGLAVHEHLARECYEAYCHYKETGERTLLDRLRESMRNCPYTAIVGNGYASLLPVFREFYPDLKLIHLKRRDRDATIRSHMRVSSMFPGPYIYYAGLTGVMRRTAAFHVGELSRSAWDELSLYDKFGWYYNYTHNVIELESSHFSHCHTIYTEDLSHSDTLSSLARFIAGPLAQPPSPVVLNRLTYLSLDDFNEEFRLYAHWLLRSLSADEIQRDPLYLADYATKKIIELTQHQLSGVKEKIASPYPRRSKQEIADILCQFEALMNLRIKEVARLKERLAAS